jgi:hypothetical protein
VVSVRPRIRLTCSFDVVSGEAEPVADPDLKTIEYYKASKLKVIERPKSNAGDPPPWLGVPPDLPIYRERGHRSLDARTYEARCRDWIWGCRMPVERIIDQWNPEKRWYRFETFCYGPKSCPLYRAGPARRDEALQPAGAPVPVAKRHRAGKKGAGGICS